MSKVKDDDLPNVMPDLGLILYKTTGNFVFVDPQQQRSCLIEISILDLDFTVSSPSKLP